MPPPPRQCARWAADNVKALSDREPELPDDLEDRAADNWEPLLAIADQAGGPWPARARGTALLLSGGRADSAETGDAGVQLLADVRTVFVNNGIDRSTTKALLGALADLEGRPWAEWNRGRPITPRQLGTLLGRFGIKPDTIRVGDATPKGYILADLTDAFGRYLPDGSATSATASKLLDTRSNSIRHRPHSAKATRMVETVSISLMWRMLRHTPRSGSPGATTTFRFDRER